MGVVDTQQEDAEQGGRGDAEIRISKSETPVFESPRPSVPASLCPRVPLSPRPRVSASPRLRPLALQLKFDLHSNLLGHDRTS